MSLKSRVIIVKRPEFRVQSKNACQGKYNKILYTFFFCKHENSICAKGKATAVMKLCNNKNLCIRKNQTPSSVVLANFNAYSLCK